MPRSKVDRIYDVSLWACCGAFIIAILLAAGAATALFVAGIVAANGTPHTSPEKCALIPTPFDCQRKCGCGWCYQNTTESGCQSLDDSYCALGNLDEWQPEKCDDKYNNAIKAVIISGAALGACIVIIGTLAAVACVAGMLQPAMGRLHAYIVDRRRRGSLGATIKRPKSSHSNHVTVVIRDDHVEDNTSQVNGTSNDEVDIDIDLDDCDYDADTNLSVAGTNPDECSRAGSDIGTDL